MTADEMAERLVDLEIEVTPAVEDAFYFLRVFEEKGETGLNTDDDDESVEEFEKRLQQHYGPANNAGERLMKIPYEERMEAIRTAYRMLDNIKKYGVACSAWAK